MSFLIPCYNEELGLNDTLTELQSIEEACDVDLKFIVIDDGSTDDTYKVALEIAERTKNLTVLRHEQNRGLGASVHTGISSTETDYFMVVPGDNCHPARGIIPLINKIGTREIVVGYPEDASGRSLIRQVLSKFFVWLVNALFGLNLRYFNGLVLHKTDLVKKIELRTQSFAFQVEILVSLLKSGVKFIEMPVLLNEKKGGSSSALKMKNIILVILCLSELLIEHRLKKLTNLTRLINKNN